MPERLIFSLALIHKLFFLFYGFDINVTENLKLGCCDFPEKLQCVMMLNVRKKHTDVFIHLLCDDYLILDENRFFLVPRV